MPHARLRLVHRLNGTVGRGGHLGFDRLGRLVGHGIVNLCRNDRHDQLGRRPIGIRRLVVGRSVSVEGSEGVGCDTLILRRGLAWTVRL